MNGQFIFEKLTAYQQAEALKAAIELGVFTAIADGSDTPDLLADRCNVSRRGIRILCDSLVIDGLLRKHEGRYALTPESNQFLNRHSPAYFGDAIRFWHSPHLKLAFGKLAEAVRQGGTAWSEEGSVEPDHPMWVDFARSMMPMMMFPAEAMARLVRAKSAGPWKVLDIAAGHGLFGIAIAKQNPLAEIVAVDWPSVLQVATENARKAGVAERYHTIAGNALTHDLGDGYDLVLVTNFLHHFDSNTCTEFLRKVYRVLKPDGRAATLDFVTAEDRITPKSAAISALLMLATTPAGDAYTFSEYERMFHDAGFAESTLHSIPPAVQQVILSGKL
jgi:ubiquinone/menaquinone biosynthesis C-methylase UbiE